MEKKIKIQVRDLNLYYGQNHALHGVNMDIKENSVTALIGPSGCGKSTFLKCINRMNDLVDNVRIEGSIEIDGENIYAPSVDTTVLRKKVGMVFQQPNPFPMSIYDNIAYGPRVHGIKDKKTLDQIVEESLKGAAIFDEVKDRLKKSAMGLSGGQQQILFMSADRRLAIFLTDELAKTGGEDVRMTHDQMARYMGSAREVVSRMLKYFAQEGWVRLYRGGVQVLDKQKLQALARGK